MVIGGSKMETVALLFVFAIIGVIGFSIMKRLDAFLEESWKQSENAIENREDIKKIACENTRKN